MRSIWMGVAVAVGACSLIVPSEPEVIYCTDFGRVGPPACPPHFVCARGVCDACADKEACWDGVDNDCNGYVDDGCPRETGTAGQAGEPGEPGGQPSNP